MNTRMTFICDQNWDTMTPTTNGRHCNACKREVIDYTRKNLNAIRANRPETEDSLCGRFRIEQVDTTLIKPVEVPRQIKYFAFISSLLLTISAKTSYSQTKDTAKTEQLESRTDKTIRTTEFCDSVNKNKYDKIVNEFADKKPFMETRKKRYYWTRKFPFIKGVRRKHTYIMGRFL